MFGGSGPLFGLGLVNLGNGRSEAETLAKPKEFDGSIAVDLFSLTFQVA